MSLNLIPLKDGKFCAECGSADLLLAVDHTEFSTLKVNDKTGTLEATYSHQEPSEDDCSVRLFCNSCGRYHEVPDTLEY